MIATTNKKGRPHAVLSLPQNKIADSQAIPPLSVSFIFVSQTRTSNDRVCEKVNDGAMDENWNCQDQENAKANKRTRAEETTTLQVQCRSVRGHFGTFRSSRLRSISRQSHRAILRQRTIPRFHQAPVFASDSQVSSRKWRHEWRLIVIPHAVTVEGWIQVRI